MKSEEEILNHLQRSTDLLKANPNESRQVMLTGYITALSWVLYGKDDISSILVAMGETDWDQWRNQTEPEEGAVHEK